MSAGDDLGRRVAEYYASEAPTRAPDRVLRAVLDSVDTTPQRRVLGRLPRRIQTMSNPIRLAAAAAAIVGVTLLGVVVLRPGSGPGVGGAPASPPSPVASPSPPALPSPSPSPTPLALDALFTSARHGLSVAHPSSWLARRATEPWTTGVPYKGSPFADVVSPGGNAFLLIASQDLAGRDGADWADEISADQGWGDDCDPPSTPITIDGEPGVTLVHCDGTPTAATWVDDRGYLVVLYGFDGDLDWFDEIIASVKLQPEDAVDSP